jgi:hypothetical protein
LSVIFYISGHGFGHASRDVEVIHALHAIAPDIPIVIRSAVNPWLLERTLRAPYELRAGACDTGIVQKTSVEHDDPATVREAIEFYSMFDARVAAEVDTLAREDVRLVVGDIPPLAFESAARLGVPSVALGNFTWDWIYETHPGMTDAAPWLVPLLRESYAKAHGALEMPFSGGFDVFPARQTIPLVARRPAHKRDDTRRHFNIPLDRPAALLSFGGYGIPSLDLARVDCQEWSIVATDRILPRGEASRWRHVVYLEEELFRDSAYRYEDLIAAVDVVMTKPGYGIVSECISCNTPMLYTSRGAFREYDVFVREMPRYLRCRFISHDDLFAGRWRDGLEAVVAQPAPPETMATNGAEVAAQRLEACLG